MARTHETESAKVLYEPDVKGLARTKDFLAQYDVQRSIAREIAMDINSLDNILKNHGLSHDDFDVLKTTPRFIQFLTEAIAVWESTANVQERIKAKSLTMIEEALPEMFAALTNPFQPLNHKVALLQQVSKLAGVGGPIEEGQIDPSARVSITISLGDGGRDVKVSQAVTPQVIEGTINE